MAFEGRNFNREWPRINANSDLNHKLFPALIALPSLNHSKIAASAADGKSSSKLNLIQIALVGKIMRTSIILLMVCLLAGCVTGPRYANTRSQDAATLVGNTKSPVTIEVTAIDGAVAPDAPIYYLTPGLHRLSITLSDRSRWGYAETDIVVGANKNYRIDADRYYVYSFTAQIVDMISGEVVSSIVTTQVGTLVNQAHFLN
jgi:hypothetical protein